MLLMLYQISIQAYHHNLPTILMEYYLCDECDDEFDDNQCDDLFDLYEELGDNLDNEFDDNLGNDLGYNYYNRNN